MSITAASRQFIVQRERLSKVNYDELAVMLAKAISSKNVPYFQELIKFITNRQMEQQQTTIKASPIDVDEKSATNNSNNKDSTTSDKKSRFQGFMKQISPKHVFSKQKLGTSKIIDLEYMIHDFRYIDKKLHEFNPKDETKFSLLTLAVYYDQQEIVKILLKHNVCVNSFVYLFIYLFIYVTR